MYVKLFISSEQQNKIAKCQKMREDMAKLNNMQELFREKEKRELEEEDKRIKEFVAERDRKLQEETDRKKDELKRKEEMGNKLGFDILIERVSIIKHIFTSFYNNHLVFCYLICKSLNKSINNFSIWNNLSQKL